VLDLAEMTDSLDCSTRNASMTKALRGGSGGSSFGVRFAITLIGGLLLAGCCGKVGENKASWAADDTGPAVVDVSRRLPNGQHDNGVVRMGPGFNYGKITSLPTGSRVTVLSNTRTSVGNWSRIRFNGNQEGWIHQDILLKGREIQSAPRQTSTVHDGCVQPNIDCYCGNTGRQGVCNFGPHKAGLYCRCD
jgi:hypothetical protein